jgi:Ankyrin repeats (3 copies)/Ankyrin repeat
MRPQMMSKRFMTAELGTRNGKLFAKITPSSRCTAYTGFNIGDRTMANRRWLSSGASADSSAPLDEEGLVLKFFSTAKRNDVAGVEDLVESDEFMQIKDTINLTDSFGNSPLMIAAQRNWSETITVLLGNEHCDVNHQNFFGSSALMCSASHGHLDALKVLCECKKVEVDLLSRFGQTALMKAAQAGKLESIEILMKHGARADIVNKQGKDAIAIAAEKGHDRVVEFLKSVVNQKQS